MGQRIGLWRFGDIGGGKYLVERLDGSVLDHPNMVLGARDPCAPAALRAYAARAEELEFIGYPSATAPGRRPTIASYHITRRDGTRPDWPGAVMSAADPCAPAALRAYARACRAVAPAGGDTSMQGGYADDVERLAEEFDRYRSAALDDGSAHGSPAKIGGTPQKLGVYAHEFFGDLLPGFEAVTSSMELVGLGRAGHVFDSLAPVGGRLSSSAQQPIGQGFAAVICRPLIAEHARAVREMGDDFEAYRAAHGAGDPAAPRHRTDDPATVERMKAGGSV